MLTKSHEKGHTRSVLGRFTRKVDQERLSIIIEDKVVNLLKSSRSKQIDVVLDSSFIKAWNTRHPMNSQIGYSDPEAGVGRTGRSYALGYKVHLSIDSETMLPLSCLFASANDNEKKHSLTILERAKQVLRSSDVKLRSLIADGQYSDGKIRTSVDRAVIPYPSNQKLALGMFCGSIRNLELTGRRFRGKSIIRDRLFGL
jgi:hypothetical protein